MILRRPDIAELKKRCASGDNLLIAAPFYTEEALGWIRPSAGGHVEFWTRLNPHDWAAGVCDPPALLAFLASVDKASLHVHRALHAKIYQVDGAWSWIGSPNLTRAAFTSNVELIAELSHPETELLDEYVRKQRTALRRLDLAEFRDFIEVAQDAVEQREDTDYPENDDLAAAVELADGLLAPSSAIPAPSAPRLLDEFVDFVREMQGRVPKRVLDHHDNTAGQNRQGHVKQSYYALHLFFSEHGSGPAAQALRSIDLDGGCPTLPSAFTEPWVSFLDRNANRKDEATGYSLSTLRNVLPERLGGYVTGGGGASGTFQRVAPLVVRFLAS